MITKIACESQGNMQLRNDQSCNSLQRANQTTFETYITHFVVACTLARTSCKLTFSSTCSLTYAWIDAIFCKKLLRSQGNMQLRNVRFIVRKSPVIQIVYISKVSKSVVACHPIRSPNFCCNYMLPKRRF